MSDVTYRCATPNEVASFCIPTFLDSYRAARAAGLISMESWYAVMRPEAEKLFRRPGVEVLVADSPDEVLYGWMAVERGWEMPFVLYVYVKASYRRAQRHGLLPEGVATGLFRAAGVDPRRAFCYAAYTPACKHLEDKIPYATWTPLRARFPPPEEKHVIVEHRKAGRP